MMGRLMNDELEMVWKNAVLAYYKYCPRICLERLRKTMKNPSGWPAFRLRFKLGTSQM
jgi:hypothetical protein